MFVFDCMEIFKKRRHMFFKMAVKNFFGAVFAGAAFLLCSCSDGNASANGDYVKASETLGRALSLFESGSYAESAGLAKEADEKVSEIVKKYPESDVAFKIVSDDSLNLGQVKYLHFRKNIMPKLKLSADADFSKVDIAFAIALFEGRVVDFADGLCKFSEYALKSSGNIKLKNLDRTEIEKIYDKILKEVYPQSDSKNIVSRARALEAKNRCLALFESGKNAKKTLKSGVMPPRADVSLRTLAPIANPQKFLKDAERNASMASYNLDASKALLEASKSVSETSEEFERFSKCLGSALSNVKKISSKKLRLPALKNIIFAMSQSGCNADVLAEIETNEDCAEMRQECYAFIAQNLILSGKIKDAELVVKKIENAKTRSLFYSYISKTLLEKCDFDGAYEFAKHTENPSISSAVLIEKAAHLWNSDGGDALKILAKAKPQGVPIEVLDKLCVAANISIAKEKTANLAYADRYVKIAKLLADSNKDTALQWLGVGVLLGSREKNAHRLNGEICEALISINAQDAVLYAQKLSEKLPFDTLAKLGVCAVGIGANKEALKFFEMAAEVASVKDAISLAVCMQLSNIEREDILKTLKPHLPKFN